MVEGETSAEVIVEGAGADALGGVVGAGEEVDSCVAGNVYHLLRGLVGVAARRS